MKSVLTRYVKYLGASYKVTITITIWDWEDERAKVNRRLFSLPRSLRFELGRHYLS